MDDGVVIRTESCIAAAARGCSNCTRNIGRGAPYLRVRFERPDDEGELHEVKRLTLCLWCRESYKED